MRAVLVLWMLVVCRYFCRVRAVRPTEWSAVSDPGAGNQRGVDIIMHSKLFTKQQGHDTVLLFEPIGTGPAATTVATKHSTYSTDALQSSVTPSPAHHYSPHPHTAAATATDLQRSAVTPSPVPYYSPQHQVATDLSKSPAHHVSPPHVNPSHTPQHHQVTYHPHGATHTPSHTPQHYSSPQHHTPQHQPHPRGSLEHRTFLLDEDMEGQKADGTMPLVQQNRRDMPRNPFVLELEEEFLWC